MAVALLVAVMAVTRDQGRIYPNVSAGGQSIGGLTQAAARRALATPLRRLALTSARVIAGDQSHPSTWRDIGISASVSQAVERAHAIGRSGDPLTCFADRVKAYWRPHDVGLSLVVDASRARTFVGVCARRFERKPVNARAEIAGNTVHIVPGRRGSRVRKDEALMAVRAWAHHQCRGDLRLPVEYTGPALSAGQLKDMDTVLATVATTLAGSSRNRRHNVALAAAAVDGLILAPGAVFSYNAVVGPRTEDKGYRTAPVIQNGKLVPGTGGGACQLSSTFYQVALRSGLEVLTRSHHSHPVAYTPAGLDATVVYGALDLKFRNHTSDPIMLWARVVGGRLVCRALGHGPAREFELLRQVRAVAPPEPLLVEDPDLSPGERKVQTPGRRGLQVRVLRRAGDDRGAAELVSNNYYGAQRAVILVGPAAPTPLPPPTAAREERPRGPEIMPPGAAGTAAKPSVPEVDKPTETAGDAGANGLPKNPLR